ncbi:MAG: hypothetical protein M3042_06520 [Actinomycetota bacterium]|nr:hypothetical protein [Actinomycetota bacterium]
MPEGDTVYLSARLLNAALAGRLIEASDFRLPALATADVAGRVAIEVLSRGKHILLRFDDGRTLHSHFRMDGSWHVYPAGGRWRRPAHDVRIVLRTAESQAVGYRLHDVELVPTAEEARLVGHLGPDLLGPGYDPEEALRRLRAQPEREIAAALLDQRTVAGIGNLYKAEVLFLRGLWPWLPVETVPNPGAVLALARRLLHANKDRWEQVTTGNTHRGEEHWVFERAGRPCRRCGTPIQVAEQGPPQYRRLTYWCPGCQPQPATS